MPPHRRGETPGRGGTGEDGLRQHFAAGNYPRQYVLLRFKFHGPRLFTATLDLEKGTAAATPLAAEKFNITDQIGLGDWSPDGEQLAYWARRSREIQEIRIVSVKTGQTRVLKPDLKLYLWRRLRWSPDGRFLLGQAIAPRGIYQIDAASGQAAAGTSKHFPRPKQSAARLGLASRKHAHTGDANTQPRQERFQPIS